MCSFDGHVRNYPQISIDNFTKKNLQSSVYFLSHCHTDHMVGLDSSEFHRRLKLSDCPRIYTSEISKLLILNNTKFAHLKSYLVTLPLETPTTLEISNRVSCSKNLEVVATVFPAGHCLGSVMILLEGDNGNVLYTGDFRLSAKELAKYKYLHCGTNKVKDINMLYFDATFSTPEALYIPTREDSSKAIISLMEPWLTTKYHHVRLICSAQYGYEYLFVELFRRFKMKIHVNESKLQKYEGITEILEVLTCSSNETRIHACRYTGDVNQKYEILTIKLSAMWFAQHVSTSDIVFKCDEHFYRACYSLHSSLTEIQNFIYYLGPKHIYPIAVPCGYTEKEVLRLFNLVQKNSQNINSNEDSVISLGPLVKSKYAEAMLSQNTDCSNSEENSCTESTKPLSNSSTCSSICLPNNSYDSERELFSSPESNATSPVKNNKRCSCEVSDHSLKSPKWNYEISSSDSESFRVQNITQ